MVEWNGIFRLFRFSEILGQPREVHPKFRNEIPEMSVAFAPQPGISGIFGRMESARSLLCSQATQQVVSKHISSQFRFKSVSSRKHQIS